MKKIYLVLTMVLAFCRSSEAQWTYAGTAFSAFVRGLFFLNANTGFAAGGDGATIAYIAKTTDGGITWTSSSTTQSILLRSIDFVDDQTGYVCGANGILMKTTDGGTTWNTIYTNSTQYFRALDFVSADVGFLAGALGTILKTTDGGITWTTNNLSQNISDVIQLHMVDATIGYAVCSAGIAPFSNGYVFKTTDGGGSWNQVYADAATGFLGLAVVDANTVYAGGLNQTIIKSTDGGSSWTTVYTGLAGISIRTGSAVSSQTIFMADDGSNVLKTDNAGSTWNDTLFGSGFYAMHFPTSDLGYLGDGAGNVYKMAVACGLPSGLSDIVLSPTSVKVEWVAVSDAVAYNIFYHPVGSTQGTTKHALTNQKFIKNLLPNTKYKWAVQSICSTNPLVASPFIPGPNFTTPPLRLGDEETLITEETVFPNPASDIATISFSLNATSPLLIRLIDVNGKVIREISNDMFSSGTHQISFNSSEFSQGIYLVQLLTSNSISTEKLMIVR